MKKQTRNILLVLAGATGLLVLINNLRSEAKSPQLVPATTGVTPVYPMTNPAISLPQIQDSDTRTSNAVIPSMSTGGIVYADKNLSVSIPLEFLSKIPILGDIFKK